MPSFYIKYENLFLILYLILENLSIFDECSKITE